ncbi:MAG: hypothetical protein ACRD3V_07170 [Vicinamibacteria bacterium]
MAYARGLFRAKWSDVVHEEWMAAVHKNFPDVTREQLERTRDLMNLTTSLALAN